MVRFVFFDLDNTLGEVTDRELFARTFVGGLVEVAVEEVNLKESFVAEVFLGVIDGMRKNPPLVKTIMDEFCLRVSEKFRVSPTVVEKIVNRFYDEKFGLLKQFYRSVKGNREVVKALLDSGLGVGVATDPITKAVAVDLRLRWAGVDGLPYCLVTHGENMHAIKPHPAYFEEILSRCGAKADEAVMVGDDLLYDIYGAKKVGMYTILVKTGVVRRGLDVKPDFEIESIREVPKVLERF
jgi:FMN phosphatase YigB (HAD superfamily)